MPIPIPPQDCCPRIFANVCVTRNSVVQEPVPDTKSLTVKIPVLLRVEMGYFTGMVVLGCIAHGVGLWLRWA